jgi:hypothetical protein
VARATRNDPARWPRRENVPAARGGDAAKV